MPKGFFSQGVCLLTNGQTTIEAVKRILAESGYHVVKMCPASENPWLGGPSAVVPFRPEVNGHVEIDVVDRVWPNTMGDPTSDPALFGAWSMGYFGPLAYPGGLARAQQHAWAWPQGRTAVQNHRGFIRLKTSYLLGAGGDAPVLPKDYDALGELSFLSRLSLAVLALPDVICYFNPNGEVLRDRSGFSQVWQACAEQKKDPLLLWANIRFFVLNEEFGFMDTVGNDQMDVADVEAIFPKSKYEPADVDYYLRNVTHYLLETDREIRTGEAFDGPGEDSLSWVVELCDNGLVQPPRRVIRLYPKANRSQIEAAIATAKSSSA